VTDLVVAGAGMAGLVCASEARALGADVIVLEKRDRPGGSMLLSSGVVWRHRDFARFRSECPRGDESLQRMIWERLDADLEWLESLGAPVTERATGNPLSTGIRFDPEGLCAALLEAGGRVRLSSPLRRLTGDTPVVLATGGFQASRELVRRYVTPEADDLLLRAAPGSTGDGLRLGLAAGGRTTAGMEELYGRAMPASPARIDPSSFVRLAQLYARHAEVTSARGERYEARTWSEVDVVQWMARQPAARAWFRVPSERLTEVVGGRTVGEMVSAAEAVGAPMRCEPGSVSVECVAGITTTLGGLVIGPDARVAPGVYACGADAGGIATGGYTSGLAAALVFGRIAARSALGASASTGGTPR
jgi:succinate dehydrogenase/fumarate reductase flavoprotein subunit